MNADFVLKFGPLSLTTRGFYGENLNSFFGGVFQGFRRDPLAVTNVASQGGWAQGVYKFNKYWSATAGFGFDDPDDKDLGAGGRARNDWQFANVVFSLTKSLIFMLELDNLKTTYLGLKNGQNQRVQFVSYYKF